MKVTACKLLVVQPVNAIWYRAISAKHWKTALGTDQTAQIPSRLNPGKAAKIPFEILYLAENQFVAYYEVEAIFGPPDEPVPNPRQTKMLLIDVSIRLRSVADLTDPGQQALLETSTQELTGRWNTYPPGKAPTQRLGAALFATKNIEGFLAISAKMPRCKTLVVFPQKLRTGSELVFDDAITRKVHRIAPP